MELGLEDPKGAPKELVVAPVAKDLQKRPRELLPTKKTRKKKKHNLPMVGILLMIDILSTIHNDPKLSAASRVILIRLRGAREGHAPWSHLCLKDGQ